MKPKAWKVGKADEDWKVAICKRDIEFSRETLSRLCYILTTSGSEDDVAQMSGADIVGAIRDYARRAALSMDAPMPPDEAAGSKSVFLRELLTTP